MCKKIIILVLILICCAFAIDKYSAATANVSIAIYAFGFDDKIHQEAFMYLLQSYEPNIRWIEDMSDPEDEQKAHSHFFTKLFKGATLLVTFSSGIPGQNPLMEVRPRDNFMYKMSKHYVLNYNTVNHDDIMAWLDKRSTKKPFPPKEAFAY